MPAVVVDASVVIAALVRAGSTRERLMLETGPRLVAPAALRRQVQANMPGIAARLGLAEQELATAVSFLLRRIQLFEDAALEPFMAKAKRMAAAAEAWDDEHYVALALLLDAPIWTYDKDFLRIKGIRVVSSQDIMGP